MSVLVYTSITWAFLVYTITSPHTSTPPAAGRAGHPAGVRCDGQELLPQCGRLDEADKRGQQHSLHTVYWYMAPGSMLYTIRFKTLWIYDVMT
jgi:hypothetical protein